MGLSDAVPAGSEEEVSKEDAEEKQDGTVSDVSQDGELLENFIMEALEHLGTMEVNVLALEQDRGNREVLDAIFRPFLV